MPLNLYSYTPNLHPAVQFAQFREAAYTAATVLS